MSNRDFINLDECKKYYLDVLYAKNPVTFFNENKIAITNLGGDLNLIIFWSKEFYNSKLDELIKIFDEKTYKVNPKVELDYGILSLICYRDLFYKADYELCKKIITLYEKISSCYIYNCIQIKGCFFGSKIIDLVIKYDEFNKGDGVFYFFPLSVLNDANFFDLSILYGDNPPFNTNDRFTGLLPYLFYSNYNDLYEILFSLIIDWCKRNFESTLPLAYFLYNFVKINDKNKIEIVLELIDNLKKDHPSYNWNNSLRFKNKMSLLIKKDKADLKIEDLIK